MGIALLARGSSERRNLGKTRIATRGLVRVGRRARRARRNDFLFSCLEAIHGNYCCRGNNEVVNYRFIPL